MHTILRLRNPLLLAALAAAYPLSGHAAAAARIEFAAGNVVAVTPAGGQRLLVKGSTLDAGETIRTSEGGHAQLKFSDGAILSLQPQTELRIDEYTFDGKG
ncbi:MAG: FecR domain-containing protein, partial [Rhodocyclaceae bacterium]|nr:FecR domain-containing protein [Rhodocyclaceae bacterium]